MTEANPDDTDDSGAGAASLAGYEYQIDVSVWLALDLILISQLAEEIVLEPATQEDIEATLTDFEPGRLVNRVPMTGYTLIVQAKRREGNAWTPKTFRTLLEHGSETRISAAKRLLDVNSRYLLVTSAGVNSDLRKLYRRHPGSWPAPDSIPALIANSIGHDISGRIAVIANQDDERLRGDINRLLMESCRVPNAQLESCRIRLREDARARIARAGGGHWRRDELERVIRTHEGYLASAPELEHYIHPNNWSDLRSAMAKRSAALIVGQSGTGKTLATKMLYDELRKEMPGLTRVPIRLGPPQLRDDTTLRPVLYDIEDPWGRFDFDPSSRPWNDQLRDFFATARPDRMIVATSRLDVALASGALNSVKPWVISLEAENYGKAERQKLYRTRIDSLPRDLHSLARHSERKVLDKLATPLEIQKFFDAMLTQDRDGRKSQPDIVVAAIDRAHQDSIEQTVIDQIEERDDVRAAAIVWALLAANDKVTRSVLREIEDHLCDMNGAIETGVSPFVDFFVAARNLRQSDGGIITYYHPRVEAGITRMLERHRQIVRQILRQLVDLLISDSGPCSKWGVGVATRILARAAEQFSVKPSVGATAKIDVWIESKLAESGKEFKNHLELAANVGSPASNGAEIARFLLHRSDSSFAGMFRWTKLEQGVEWYQARRNNPSTKSLIEKFIRTILPHEHIDYPESFADELARLSSGLAAAFLDAAKTIVHFGYISSDDAIACGALCDIDGFEAVIDMAVAVLTPTEEERKKHADAYLDVVNDVYSDDYAQYVFESDDGYTATQFLKAYVEFVHKNLHWKRIAKHVHANALRPYWFRALTEQAREDQLDYVEFADAFQAGYGTKDEDDLWLALLKRWNPRYSQPLATRIHEGSPYLNVEHAALACLLEHQSGIFASIIAALVDQGAANRLVEISRGIADFRSRRFSDGAKHLDAAEAALAQLPPQFAEICRAEIALFDNAPPVLSDAARDTLAAIPDAGDQVRILRLKLDANIPMSLEDDVRWALGVSDDSKTAVLAIEVAIRHKMTKEVETALDHRFAHVVARALTAVANPLAAPLPARFLALATHRASPVRRALVEVLKSKPHPEHQATLIKLAGDQWSKDTMQYGNGIDDFPIAQAAIAALSDLIPLGGQDEEALFAIAIDTSDPDVRYSIFQLLAKAGTAMQKKLFDLAVEPGRAQVRSSAAYALLVEEEQIAQSVIDEITPYLINTRYEPVAGVLALLVGCRGTISAVRKAAEELATNSKRRALILLIVWLLKDRNITIANELVAMLPPGHKAVAWALGGTLDKIDDETIADLGDHGICAEVLRYMKQ